MVLVDDQVIKFGKAYLCLVILDLVLNLRGRVLCSSAIVLRYGLTGRGQTSEVPDPSRLPTCYMLRLSQVESFLLSLLPKYVAFKIIRGTENPEHSVTKSHAYESSYKEENVTAVAGGVSWKFSIPLRSRLLAVSIDVQCWNRQMLLGKEHRGRETPVR